MSAQTDVYRAAYALLHALDQDTESATAYRLARERAELHRALANAYADQAIDKEEAEP